MKLTVQEWMRRATEERIHTYVFLDGDDVTDRCIEADDEEGYVTHLAQMIDEKGKPTCFLINGTIATHTRYGNVSFATKQLREGEWG